MAHFAKIGANGKVIAVLTMDNVQVVNNIFLVVVEEEVMVQLHQVDFLV